MARRSTKLEVLGRKLMGKILEDARQSKDFQEKIKALKAFINYEAMLIKVQGAKRPGGYGIEAWQKLARKAANKPHPGYQGS